MHMHFFCQKLECVHILSFLNRGCGHTYKRDRKKLLNIVGNLLLRVRLEGATLITYY